MDGVIAPYTETGDIIQNGDDITSLHDVITMAYNLSSLSDNRTMSNQSVEDLLTSYLGSRYRSPAESTVLTIVYTFIFLTGIVGNVSTCIVITKNSYMHTATNYYLFSLAISDMMTLILGLPPELYTIWEAYPWRLGAPYCLFKTFLTEMTSSASILTIAAFTVERYVAICHPIKAQTMSSLSRALKIIVTIWLSAALTALPYPIHTRTFYYISHPDTNIPIPDSFICNILPLWRPRMQFIFQLSTFLLFVLPMSLITSLYVLIGITLRKSGLARQTSEVSGSPPHSQSRRTVLKMLVAVVVAFFICWAPFHSQRLMTVYISDSEWTPTLLEIQSLLFYTSGVLYFVSATVNPILYNLMSLKYRQAFKDTLCRCCLPASSRSRLRSRYGGYERSTTCISYTRSSSRKASHQNSPLIRGRVFRRANSDDVDFQRQSGKNSVHQHTQSWRDRVNARRQTEGSQIGPEQPNGRHTRVTSNGTSQRHMDFPQKSLTIISDLKDTHDEKKAEQLEMDTLSSSQQKRQLS